MSWLKANNEILVCDSPWEQELNKYLKLFVYSQNTFDRVVDARMKEIILRIFIGTKWEVWGGKCKVNRW